MKTQIENENFNIPKFQRTLGINNYNKAVRAFMFVITNYPNWVITNNTNKKLLKLDNTNIQIIINLPYIQKILKTN